MLFVLMFQAILLGISYQTKSLNKAQKKSNIMLSYIQEKSHMLSCFLRNRYCFSSCTLILDYLQRKNIPLRMLTFARAWTWNCIFGIITTWNVGSSFGGASNVIGVNEVVNNKKIVGKACIFTVGCLLVAY